MKNTVNNILIIIITTIVALSSGYFIYKTYDAYKDYKIIQKSEKNILFINNLNTILQKVEQEQASSALYLGYGGKTDFNQLENIRKSTDTAINNTKLFIQNNPIFSSYKQKLDNLITNLQYVRSRVDVVSSDYKSILFEYYQNEISQPILKIIEKDLNELASGLHTLKDYIYTYLDFIKFRDNVNKEKSFISFLLAQSKKMSNQDLVLWDKIIENQIIPSYKSLDNQIITKIETNIDTKQFTQSSFQTRVEIAKGILNGNYTLNSTQWLYKMDEKIERINRSEKTIFNFLRNKTDNINISPDKIIINIAIAIFLLLLLIYLISLIRKNRNAKKRYMKRKKEAEQIRKNNNLIDIDYDEEDQTYNIESFNAIKEFTKIMKDFTEEADKKQIAISNYIDPNIPTSCTGNLKQIKQVLANLLNHAINSTKSYGTINVRIENSAEKEMETAVKFSIIESGIQISEEYRHKIMRSFYNEEILKTENLKTKKTDLITTAILVANMDGIFEINNSSQDGTIISFAVSLKKTDQFDTKSLVA